jgi:transcriptional regulator with PAS, ATPase and Fis domain
VELGKEVEALVPKAITFLEQYPYGGNVCERQNMIERGWGGV